ncbi:MAG: hypothetical protein EA369_00465 [Bradymonadales bacterium]|nr:MAG: hypothetical protein EA369_00465 [Bradymonadales bacterium]
MATPIRIHSYDHVKAAVKDLPAFERVLSALGFSSIDPKEAPSFLEKPAAVWGSGEAVFCLYPSDHPLAKAHFDEHQDTIFDLSFLLEEGGKDLGVIPGVGGMKHTVVSKRSFPAFPVKKGILRFDHNTINLEMGKLNQTVCDYLMTFHLEKGQFFDIKTDLTGLKSWVTRSPSGGVQIPFNEASDPKSQIQEYIEVHRGPGVQHIALLTEDIISSMTKIVEEKGNPIRFLDIPDTYYELARGRVKIREDFADLESLRILVDQDEKGGYLLQIFTQNIFGGFFFELIQREGNTGFGEGNFQALFESIELDQKRRGVL